MKFLHTADLHIGKRLEGRARFDEQKAALCEIALIAKTEKADVALIAGDVFDVTSPSAEAKRMFYRFALELADVCPVIAISGNHDGAAELSAPSDLADAADIKLIGSPGLLTMNVGGENLNVAAVPYPDERTLSPYDGEYGERVAALLRDTASGFRKGENNILLSHLFMTGASEEPSENTLGPARMLPKTVIPDGCYAALGHIHKPSVVSKSRHIYYAGSPLNYHFDGTNAKSVIIGEMTGGELKKIERVPLLSGKTLITERVDDFDGAVAALERNGGNLVKLQYASDEPLSLSETKKLRSYECFVKLEPITRERKEESGRASIKTKTDAELFTAYYESRKGEKPSDSLMSLYADLLALAKGEK